MAGILGGGAKTNAATAPKYTQMNVQSSAYGLAIPVVYGTTRIAPNLLWYANFQSHQVNNASSGGGGKGGVVGGGGKGCVAGETIIAGPDGAKRIDAIAPGDRVWSQDPASGLLVPGVVVEVLKHAVAETGDKMLRVYLRGRDRALHLTTNHYPWIDGALKREIADWRWGDQLIGIDGEKIAISHMLRAPDVEHTYNLVVEPHHNFFAEGLLLHNGGGGGGGKSGGSTTYSADVICGFCEGTIAGIPNSWASQTLEVGTPGFSVFDGALAQSGDPYLEDNYPSQFLNYSGTCYGIAASLDLGSSANLPNINAELQAILQATAPSTYGGNGCIAGGDADPSLVVPDMLTNGQYGLGFPAARIGQVSANDEAHAVPSSGPYTVTVSNAGQYLYPINAVDTVVGGVGTNLYTAVSGTPGPFQYNFNPATGVYSFNAAQAGVTVNIRYASLGALTNYQSWCLAAGLWISPAYTQQTQASSLLDDIATATYSEAVWSSGVLTFIPRATAAVSGNGHSFTPPSEPLFALGVDDFMPNTNPTGTVSAAANDDPVIVTRTRASDQYNDIKIEALDRANQYAPTVVEVVDQALIDQYGRRASASKSLHLFCDVSAANVSAQLQLNDENIRNTYSVQLDERYCVLDPMDLVTLTDPDFPGLSAVPARLTSATENDDGTLSLVFEDYLGQLGTAALQSLNTGSGYTPNFDEEPGPVNASILFSPPIALADNQGLEIWCGLSSATPATCGGIQVMAASASGGPYRLLGTLGGNSRMGVTTADFPAGGDPDRIDTLNVDLSMSAGTIESGSDSDADQGNTVCLVRGASGDEYIAFSAATLTGANQYALGGYLRRGLYGTASVDHPSGAPFLRLDQLVFAIPYQASQIGQTLYLKFLPFNIFGGGLQDIGSATAYSIVLPAPPAPPDVANFGATQSGAAVAFDWDAVPYPAVALAGYLIGYAPQGTTDWSDFTLLTEAAAGTEMTNADVPPGTWVFGIRAASIAYQPGSGSSIGLSPDIATFNLVVTSANETIYDNDEAATQQGGDSALAPASGGWGGTLSGFVLHYTGVLIPDGQHDLSTYAPGTGLMSATSLWSSLVQDPVATSTYTTGTIDTGYVDSLRVFDAVTSALLPGNTGAAASIALSIDDWSSGSDPNTFNPWTIGYATFRYLRARISYSASNGNVSFIEHFTPKIDTAPSTVTGDNVVIAGGGTAVTFPEAFHTAPFVVATPVGSSALYATATNITATGCTIHVWNSSGSDVGGTVNYTATGE